ncbi:MAG: NlpC/P60 family protein [Bacteroidota bacterium]
MERGIAFQGYVPMRKEPSETSEMGSQVLFGEQFRILSSDGKWIQISLDFDGSEGWVLKSSIATAQEKRSETGSAGSYRMVFHPFITVQNLKSGHQFFLPAGSIWPKTDGNRVTMGSHEFELLSEEGLITPGPSVDPEEIGKGLNSLPYLWGGRSGFGFDGPGLIQMLCRMSGYSLPRQCNQQAEMGITINFMHEIRKGDLAYFDNDESELIHVGMVLDGGRVLHCSTNVRIDRLDHQGIFNIEREEYTHKLRIIKRV